MKCDKCVRNFGKHNFLESYAAVGKCVGSEIKYCWIHTEKIFKYLIEENRFRLNICQECIKRKRYKNLLTFIVIIITGGTLLYISSIIENALLLFIGIVTVIMSLVFGLPKILKSNQSIADSITSKKLEKKLPDRIRDNTDYVVFTTKELREAEYRKMVEELIEKVKNMPPSASSGPLIVYKKNYIF